MRWRCALSFPLRGSRCQHKNRSQYVLQGSTPLHRDISRCNSLLLHALPMGDGRGARRKRGMTMKKRLFSILLMCCMALTLLPTAVFAEGEAVTGNSAIQFGADAISVLSKNANTANAPTVYFGQNHENNPGAWRVIGYDGNSAAGIAGNMTLLAANNMGLSKFGASNAYAGSDLNGAIDALADKCTGTTYLRKTG